MNKIQKVAVVNGTIVGNACAYAIYIALKNMTKEEINRLSDYIATDYMQYNETWQTILLRFYRANIKAGCYLTGISIGVLTSVIACSFSIDVLKDIARIINKFKKILN